MNAPTDQEEDYSPGDRWGALISPKARHSSDLGSRNESNFHKSKLLSISTARVKDTEAISRWRMAFIISLSWSDR